MKHSRYYWLMLAEGHLNRTPPQIPQVVCQQAQGNLLIRRRIFEAFKFSTPKGGGAVIEPNRRFGR